MVSVDGLLTLASVVNTIGPAVCNSFSYRQYKNYISCVCNNYIPVCVLSSGKIVALTIRPLTILSVNFDTKLYGFKYQLYLN